MYKKHDWTTIQLIGQTYEFGRSRIHQGHQGRLWASMSSWGIRVAWGHQSRLWAPGSLGASGWYFHQSRLGASGSSWHQGHLGIRVISGHHQFCAVLWEQWQSSVWWILRQFKVAFHATNFDKFSFVRNVQSCPNLQMLMVRIVSYVQIAAISEFHSNFTIIHFPIMRTDLTKYQFQVFNFVAFI